MKSVSHIVCLLVLMLPSLTSVIHAADGYGDISPCRAAGRKNHQRLAAVDFKVALIIPVVDVSSINSGVVKASKVANNQLGN